MWGAGETFGLISLCGQAITEVREVYSIMKSYEATPEQVQTILTDCNRLSEVLYQVQSLVSSCDRTAPSVQDLFTALAININRCHDEIAKIRGKIEHLRPEQNPSRWEKIKTTIFKDFFSDIHNTLTAQREYLALWLQVLEMKLNQQGHLETKHATESMGANILNAVAANGTMIQSMFQNIQLTIERSMQAPQQIVSAPRREEPRTQSGRAVQRSQTNTHGAPLRSKARHFRVSKPLPKPRTKRTALTLKSTSRVSRPKRKTYNMQIILPAHVEIVVNGNVVERRDHIEQADWENYSSEQRRRMVQSLIMLRGMIWMMGKVRYMDPFRPQLASIDHSLLAREGGLASPVDICRAYDGLRARIREITQMVLDHMNGGCLPHPADHDSALFQDPRMFECLIKYPPPSACVYLLENELDLRGNPRGLAFSAMFLQILVPDHWKIKEVCHQVPEAGNFLVGDQSTEVEADTKRLAVAVGNLIWLPVAMELTANFELRANGPHQQRL
ncbi:hypothetical protein H2200_005122 [Cladophialophora chaetospira]|uniref:Fungal N-terminal domain-containing protein n=1 Tax=Cladophialophora chaetospira TaxID=386627 RepID=A0AA38XBD1_9EURO|nr:hypothetical protein H2200_005122 [Cladophialophora chaetospira]